MTARNILMAAAGNTGDVMGIEDVFSTDIFTAQNTATTVVNGIDLATKGGMVWTKSRNQTSDNYINFTNSGAPTYVLRTNKTNALGNESGSVSSWNTNGFTGWPFGSSWNFASWTFRKQPKFFDVVTYTGDGASSRVINHNLGVAPAFVMVKATSTTSDWFVLARYTTSGGAFGYYKLNLNSTASQYGNLFLTGNETSFPLEWFGTSATAANAKGVSYVMYLFAHNAGGFGLTGTDNVISCGSYTGNGSTTGPVINLDYEPQWVMIKNAIGTGNWFIGDNMRGLTTSPGIDPELSPNSSGSERWYFGSGGANWIQPTATGFQITESDNNFNFSGDTYIYIAIRRGPMKTPTSGTSVFNAIARTGTGVNATVTNSSFTPDIVVPSDRAGTYPTAFTDRLRGQGVAGAMNLLRTSQTSAESYDSGIAGLDVMNGFVVGAGNYGNGAGRNYVNWLFRRAPGFFDQVCYTGTGVARTVAHNLGVVPEMMIVKQRNATRDWSVYEATTRGALGVYTLNSSGTGINNNVFWNNTNPTASVFTVGTNVGLNASGGTYVAYLFASCPGVSKVGSYTGNGSSQTINCGFTGGARFVMVKRVDNDGDWFVWDSARGINSSNDPYLGLNSTSAEVTGTDAVDPNSTGFVVNQEATFTNINVSGGTFIFLAIA